MYGLTRLPVKGGDEGGIRVKYFSAFKGLPLSCKDVAFSTDKNKTFNKIEEYGQKNV